MCRGWLSFCTYYGAASPPCTRSVKVKRATCTQVGYVTASHRDVTTRRIDMRDKGFNSLPGVAVSLGDKGGAGGGALIGL